MIKRLAAITALSVSASLIPLSAASAQTNCTTTLGVLQSCQPSSSSPQPSSQPSQPSQPAPSSQPASQPAPSSQPAGTIAEAGGAADRMLALVNNERAAHGLGALSMRSDVVGIAAGHSRAMASKRTIWHNDAYFTSSNRSALRAKLLGENVAMNSSVDDAHRRLMNSPGHRANILDGRFTQVGISVVHDERGFFYFTQNFMTPEDGPAATPAKKKGSKAAKATKSKSRSKKAAKGRARVRRARR